MTITATTHQGLSELLEVVADGRPDWQGRAACRGMDTGMFYPTRGESPVEARQVCQRCDVQPECLNHALAAREKHGVWGDTSERIRRQIRRRQAARNG